VVDCGAIATTLIDSELFGHERGAYTGAEQRAQGRLAEADGSTILLDEIGELPLEVQSKILRFVQEKQFTPVGSTQAQKVDVRVIAVTNRDLATEVTAGRFREDLFHRLNVVRLVVPPLRERPEDIPLLAQHFLEQFSIQHKKPVRRLSPAAEQTLLAYRWPGNVRELQNRIMRAVVLCEGDQIESRELELSTNAPGPLNGGSAPGGGMPIPDRESVPPADTYEEIMREVRQALIRQIETALENGSFPPPIGKWASEDLVLQAYRLARETAARAAAILAIPETTFRRRLQKAQAGADLSPRPEAWDPVREQIARLVDAGNPAGEDLMERVRRALLEEVASRLPRDFKRASALLGVTEPTYRRWVAELVVSA
jgi:DNA-binding NtrC family response regulator